MVYRMVCTYLVYVARTIQEQLEGMVGVYLAFAGVPEITSPASKRLFQQVTPEQMKIPQPPHEGKFKKGLNFGNSLMEFFYG